MQVLKWLYPGMNVKRWILVLALGVLMVSAGLGLAAGVEVALALEWLVSQFTSGVTYALPDRLYRVAGILLTAGGVFLIAVGLRQMIRSLVAVVLPGGPEQLADLVFAKRHLARGPRVVVVGGGTGLSVLLRGLKQFTSNITAIVTVADDGGSSGRLRNELGILPPGDIRNTLVALADTEPLMERLFQYRFGSGEGLAGHSFGNLFIAAMTAITGDFEEAVRASSKVLAIRGQVLPSTLSRVSLWAEYEDGSRVRGESNIPQVRKRIRRIGLDPAEPEALPAALEALARADVIVLGPGSLYTSVLPNLLVRGVAEAIRRSRALKVYVCNVMTQPGETDGYTASDHVRAIVDHVGRGLIDVVLLNGASISGAVAQRYRREGAFPVVADAEAVRSLGPEPVVRPLLAAADLARHDPRRLATAILQVAVARGKVAAETLVVGRYGSYLGQAAPMLWWARLRRAARAAGQRRRHPLRSKR